MNLGYRRTFYLDKILSYLDNTGLIKVLIGQRRVGKSTLMKQIIDFLQTNRQIPVNNIIYINLEVDYLSYTSTAQLKDYIKEQINNKGNTERVYLFIDEIQELPGREKLINAYRADDAVDIDIFITGSNANLLSSDLATYLAGRYIDIEIMSFSYSEYLGYHQQDNTKDHFLYYSNYSGIPELYKLSDRESQTNFLKSIKDSIILKDIIKRYAIKDVDLLEKLFLYLAGNIGNLFSINSIVKKLKNLNIHTNTTTIGNYLNYLERTFIIHAVPRYDLKGKKILEGEKKYYLNDLAFNNFFASSYDIGGGKKLENIIYNHLRQHGYQVYVGTLGNLEIDFVAERGKERLYIQVAYLITDDIVFQREFGNLTNINDNYPKVVLSLDDMLMDYEGIVHQNIRDFIAQ